MSTDADVWLYRCEGCDQWLSPDDGEITMPDKGEWAGSWICPDCAERAPKT